MKSKIIFSGFLMAFALISCDKNEPEVVEESLYKESGYLVASINETTAGNSYYAGHLDALTGSTPVDMTTKSTYNFFYSNAKWKNFMFGRSLKGENFLTKIAVDKAGKLIEVASFPTLGVLNSVKIINDNLAIYTDFGNSNFVGMFNPTTMENLGVIDMSKAKKIAENDRNFYINATYRKQDNKLFLYLVTDSDKTSQYYDATDIFVEVVNMNTKQWEKTITYKGANDPTARGGENSVIDENGNIYIFTQGTYGLDGSLGPQAPKYSRPQILKIPANGTDFDANYSFNPVNVLGQTNLLVQLMLGAIYDSNGIAYSCISAQSESPRIFELVGKFAQGIITEAEFFELRSSIFYSPTQRWVKLDLNAKTVTPIADIPLTAGFGYPVAYKYDGKFYMQYNTPSDKTSGFFEYTPSTGKATKVVSITNGGIATDLLKLEK